MSPPSRVQTISPSCPHLSEYRLPALLVPTLQTQAHLDVGGTNRSHSSHYQPLLVSGTRRYQWSPLCRLPALLCVGGTNGPHPADYQSFFVSEVPMVSTLQTTSRSLCRRYQWSQPCRLPVLLCVEGTNGLYPAYYQSFFVSEVPMFPTLHTTSPSWRRMFIQSLKVVKRCANTTSGIAMCLQ